MPSRAEIFFSAKEVCAEVEGVDPSGLTDIIIRQDDPNQTRPVGVRAWALKIAKYGFPPETRRP